MEEIILASTSPRRREMCKQMGIPYRIVAPECNEEEIDMTGSGDTSAGDTIVRKEDVRNNGGTITEELVKKLALIKGKSVYSILKDQQPLWIAGFDTLVELDNTILGKASCEREAHHMLSLLSAKVHLVYTGIALYSSKTGVWDVRAGKSEVKFASLTREEIEFYLSTGEWQGVAGSYRIQERGSLFIEWIKGSYSNIVGLPISLFYVMLKNNNYFFSSRKDN